MADWACRCSAVLRHMQKADRLRWGEGRSKSLWGKIRRPVASSTWIFANLVGWGSDFFRRKMKKDSGAASDSFRNTAKGMGSVESSGFLCLLFLQKRYKRPASCAAKNYQSRKNHIAVFNAFFILFWEKAVLTAKYETDVKIVGRKNLRGDDK